MTQTRKTTENSVPRKGWQAEIGKKSAGERLVCMPETPQPNTFALKGGYIRVTYSHFQAKPGDLTVDRMPSVDPHAKLYQEEFLFTVSNPMRSDFNGTAPTSQTFDVEVFFVDGNKETSVWKWSEGHFFSQMVTKVVVPAVGTWKPQEAVVWRFKAGEVKDGKYRAVATFIPTGSKQAVANFTITSAH